MPVVLCSGIQNTDHTLTFQTSGEQLIHFHITEKLRLFTTHHSAVVPVSGDGFLLVSNSKRKKSLSFAKIPESKEPVLTLNFPNN